MSKPAVVRYIAALSPTESGRLLNAHEVSDSVFGGQVSKKWVCAKPGHYCHVVGRIVL
ncbi:hypothetical protein [Gemmatimonas phototrophica]|uniref:hypothetical protein n=1 Tax=Gemmatimonas phototrophica TaxID=1379270 RepID=UPI000A8CABB2|nr:hypothetical protein [Gemmatimonas phototrophica]